MTAGPSLPRRALAGALGLAVAAPAAAVALPMPPGATDRLWRCLRLLEQAEAAFCSLPDDDDDEANEATCDRMDAVLAESAMIRPDTAEGYAVKALIAQRWGDASPAGVMVYQWLLANLIERRSLT